ncbi:MAG TPA: hypothetical protein VIL86_13775, partial [Tepidisphaeraceae bacterium]
ASVHISWMGYAYNLGWVTAGNIAGGALFVGGMYWLGSPDARVAKVQAEAALSPARRPAQGGPAIEPALTDVPGFGQAEPA